MFQYELATSLMLNIEKYCYSYLNGLADLWCLRGRCLPIEYQVYMALTLSLELINFTIVQIAVNCRDIYNLLIWEAFLWKKYGNG